MGVSSAGGDRDGVALRARIAQHRKRQASRRRLHGDEITVRQSHLLGGNGIHLGDGLPADLRDGVRNLLQPRLVRAAPVADEGVRIDDEVHVAARLLDRRRGTHRRNGTRRRRLAERAGSDPARQCSGESGGASRETADQPGAVVGHWIARRAPQILLRHGDQHVGSRARVEHRIHRRLLKRDRSANRLGVSPLLERVMIGKNQVGELRRFVRIAREADLERHLRHRRGKSCRLWKRECRVGPAHHQQRNAAGVHAFGESAQLRRRRHPIEAEVAFVRLDRDADIPLRLIECVRGERDFQSVSAAAAGENHARLGRGKFAREAIENRCGDTRCLRCLLGRQLATEHAHDRHLAARPAVDPLVSVETGERAARANINESRRSFVIGARIREIELLRHHRAPAVEEVRSDRNDEPSSAEIEAWPRDAVALAVGGDRGVIRTCIVAQMGGHPEAGEPRIEEAGKLPDSC